MRIVAMLLVALLLVLPAAAFAAPLTDIPEYIPPTVVQAEFQPGISTANVVLDSGEPGTITMLHAPEIQNNRMYVSLDAICQVLDCPVDLDYGKNELVIPASSEIRVPVDRDTLEKEACGEDVRVMLPLREIFEKQGWKVDWREGKAVIYSL